MEENKNIEQVEAGAESAKQKTSKLSAETKESLWQSLKFLLFSISAGVNEYTASQN